MVNRIFLGKKILVCWLKSTCIFLDLNDMYFVFDTYNVSFLLWRWQWKEIIYERIGYTNSKNLSPPNFPESSNSGLKINNNLNAHSSWQEYARTTIQLPSEISDSDLSLKAKKCMCSFKTVGGVCLWSCNELGNI